MLAAMSLTGDAPPWAVPLAAALAAAPAASAAADVSAQQQWSQQLQQQPTWPPPAAGGRGEKRSARSRQGSGKRCKTSQYRGVATTENNQWRWAPCTAAHPHTKLSAARRALRAEMPPAACEARPRARAGVLCRAVRVCSRPPPPC